MKKLITIFGFLILLGKIAIGQDMDFRCDSVLFSVSYVTWIDPIQNCDDRKYDFYSNTVNFDDIPQHDLEIINRTKQTIIKRGGLDFFNKLILKQVIISQRPNKCDGKKYSLRYIFPLDSDFYYRFSMTYDKEGNLLSEYRFPDFSENKNILNIIDKCNAVLIAKTDSIFKAAYDNPGHISSRKIEGTDDWEQLGSISNMELAFDNSKNIWVWKIYSETNYDGEMGNKTCVTGTWIGKVITINAHDSTIISVDEYKELKSVTYGYIK